MMFFVASPLPSVLRGKKLKAFPSGQIVGVISKEDRPYCLLRPNKAKEDLKTLLPVNNGFNLPPSLSLSSPLSLLVSLHLCYQRNTEQLLAELGNSTSHLSSLTVSFMVFKKLKNQEIRFLLHLFSNFFLSCFSIYNIFLIYEELNSSKHVLQEF